MSLATLLCRGSVCGGPLAVTVCRWLDVAEPRSVTQPCAHCAGITQREDRAGRGEP